MTKLSRQPVKQSRQVTTDQLFTKWIRYGDLAASDGSIERLRFGKFVQNPGCKLDVGKRSCSSSSSCEGTQDSLWLTWWPTSATSWEGRRWRRSTFDKIRYDCKAGIPERREGSSCGGTQGSSLSEWWPTWPAGLTENGEEITMLWTTREFVMKYTLGIIDKQTNGQMPRWDNYHLKALKIRNADVKILTKDFSTAQGAQKRLRDRSSSNSSVQYLYEMRGSPERGGERGTTSRTTAWTSSPKVAQDPSVRDDSGNRQAWKGITLCQGCWGCRSSTWFGCLDNGSTRLVPRKRLEENWRQGVPVNANH